MFSVFSLFFIVISLTLGCHSSSDEIPVVPSTKTGTLKGNISIPIDSLREKNYPENAEINNSIRATQNFKNAKVHLEYREDIDGEVDEEGNYTIKNVPFGKHRVVASFRIGNDEYKWRSEEQSVYNTSIVKIPEIIMQPANISIAGTVYDAVSKEPIQGVVIEVWGQTSTSQSDGKYTVYNMPAGSWDVTYTKDGYQILKTPISFAEGVESAGNFYLVPEGNKDATIASNSGLITLTELVPAYKAEAVSNQTNISAFFCEINTHFF